MANLQKIAALIKICEETDLTEIEVTAANGRIFIKRQRGITADKGSKKEQKTTIQVNETSKVERQMEVSSSEFEIISPMVGFFRARMHPIVVGDKLRAGDVVGFIESLSLMNEVSVERNGEVLEMFVQNGSPVGFAQSLFKLKILEMEEVG